MSFVDYTHINLPSQRAKPVINDIASVNCHKLLLYYVKFS